LPAESKTAEVAAKEGLAYCNSLFALERQMHALSPEERCAMRLSRSRPLVDEFHAWLVFQRPRVLPKSAFGQAIFYCLNQWDKLTAFLKDGRLELDNNRAERSIKPFVIRKEKLVVFQYAQGRQGQCDHLQHRGDCQGKRPKSVCIS